MSRGTIKKVAGPLVIAKGMRDANMYDVVRVSSQRLIGEIIEMHEDEASIQVYEETSGLRPGEPVESMEVPLSVELGPGLITSIYDGIQRPLDDIMKVAGSNNLKRGVEVPALKRDKKWNFIPVAKVGDQLEGGDVLGTVQETIVVTQKIMVPPNMKGTLKEIKSGEFTVDETVAVLSTADGDKELTLMQHWPVRRGRPYKKKLPPAKPLVQDSVLLIPCSLLPRVVWQQFPARSEAVRRLSSISLQNGLRQISWFISAAVSVEMR